MTTPGLISFGTVSQRPAPDQLDEVRTLLQQQSYLAPICHTLQGLKKLWETLISQNASLESINGPYTATQLSEWITGAISSKQLENNGSLLQMPLTILVHIAQYIVYLRHGEESHEAIIDSTALGGVQGFGIGILSALAIASAKTENDLGRLGATSIKFAFCIGAYVDLDYRRRCGQNGRTRTLSVRWKTPTTFADVETLVNKHSEVSKQPKMTRKSGN